MSNPLYTISPVTVPNYDNLWQCTEHHKTASSVLCWYVGKYTTEWNENVSSSEIKIPAIFFSDNNQPSPIHRTNRQLNRPNFFCRISDTHIYNVHKNAWRFLCESDHRCLMVWQQRSETVNATSIKNKNQLSMDDEQIHNPPKALYPGQSGWAGNRKTFTH